MTKRNTPPTSGVASGASRRDFIKGAAAAGVGFWVLGRTTWAEEVTKATSPNEKVNVASIGVGGKGDSDSDHAGKYGNLVAICDVDEGSLNKKAEKFPKAKKFTDYRKMLDAMGKEIEAVTVSTPDHQHFHATQLFIGAGKHCYTQKPMTHDVWEARQLRELANKHKVATQMGNQGTAGDGFRKGVEVIRSGALGDIKEVHVWTNRPIWPQAPKVTARPSKEDPVPSTLHWDEWLGTAPTRPYVKGVYHAFNWRGWWDFGTGALGDMGCHTANLPFMALKLEYPTSFRGESEDLNPETYPGWARVNYEFPARGSMPPVKVVWYEGRKDGKLVHPPEDLQEKVLPEYKKILAERAEKEKKKFDPEKSIALNNSGSLVVGTKGILYSPHDYGEEWVLLPVEQYKGHKDPEKTLARNGKGDDGQKIEWLAACKGGPAAFSNFNYAGLLTEFILLGNVAIKHAGQKLEWDGPGMKVTNVAAANKLLRREYRKGWEVNV